MPKQFKMMAALSGCHVPDQPELALSMKNRAAMRHRLRQPPIAIMTRIEQIERASCYPPVHLHRWHAVPTEWPLALGLIEPVHEHGVLRRCAPVKQTLVAISYVLVGSRIHQKDSAIPN